MFDKLLGKKSKAKKDSKKTSKKTLPKSRCASHRSHEIDDGTALGQTFWCEHCHSVRRVTYQGDGSLIVQELKPAQVVH